MIHYTNVIMLVNDRRVNYHASFVALSIAHNFIHDAVDTVFSIHDVYVPSVVYWDDAKFL